MDAENSPFASDFLGYTLESKLHEGRMSSVFLAKRTDGSYEVLKSVPEEHTQRDVDKLIKEYFCTTYLARLDQGGYHPNIPVPYKLSMEKRPFFSMERLSSIQDVPELNMGALLDDLVDSVEHVHERGIVHRDIKPPNICRSLCEDGSYKLIDFALACTPEESLKTESRRLLQGTPSLVLPFGFPIREPIRFDWYCVLKSVTCIMTGGRILPEGFDGSLIESIYDVNLQNGHKKMLSSPRKYFRNTGVERIKNDLRNLGKLQLSYDPERAAIFWDTHSIEYKTIAHPLLVFPAGIILKSEKAQKR